MFKKDISVNFVDCYKTIALISALSQKSFRGKIIETTGNAHTRQIIHTNSLTA